MSRRARLDNWAWLGLGFAAALIAQFALFGGEGEDAEPHSPPPPRFASETIVLSSAGQGNEAYVVQDVLSGLRLRSLFIPRAEPDDLEGAGSLILTLGYSPVSLHMQGSGYDEERARVEALLDAAASRSLPVLALYLGGRRGGGERYERLVDLVLRRADYVVAVASGGERERIDGMAGARGVPISTVPRLEDLSLPLSAAFR